MPFRVPPWLKLTTAGWALATGLACAAAAPTYWRAVTSPNPAATFAAVASDDHQFIAVGDHGATAFSTDIGRTWSAGPVITSRHLRAVGFGDGRWVAVGAAGVILSSDDGGKDWIARPAGVTTDLSAVAYSPHQGQWLVVGAAGTVLTSRDGTTWSAASVGDRDLAAVIADDERFYFGGEGGSLYFTAAGQPPTQVAIPTTADVTSLARSGEQLIVAGSQGLLARVNPGEVNTWRPALGVNADARFTSVVAVSHDAVFAAGTGGAGTYDWTTETWTEARGWPATTEPRIATLANQLVAVGPAGWLARASGSWVKISSGSAPDEQRVTALVGEDVTLTAEGPLAGASSYQWSHDDETLPAASGPQLRLSGMTADQAGHYRVAVTAGGEIFHGTIELRVLPRGAPPTEDPEFSAEVHPLAQVQVKTQGDGKLLVWGPYLDGRDPRSVLIRLGLDGALDPGFEPFAIATPRPAAIDVVLPTPAGTYVGGSFRQARERSLPGLVRLREDGRIDETFVPTAQLGTVSRIVAADAGRIVVQAATSILRLQANGAIDPRFAGIPVADGDALIGVDHAGRILIAADFGRTLERYSPTGSLDPTYGGTWDDSGFGFFTYDQIVGDEIFGTTGTQGRLGRFTAFVRRDGSLGLPRADYISPPTPPYGSGISLSYLYRRDGGVWTIRGTPLGADTALQSYDSSGNRDLTRFARPADDSLVRLLELAPDGTLYALRLGATTLEATKSPLLRLQPKVGAPSQLTNLSARSYVASAADPLIMGVIGSGTGTSPAIVRALGPALAAYGITDAMADPVLQLIRDDVVLDQNDQWPAALAPEFARIGAASLGAGSRDAALAASLERGATTVVARSVDGGPGTALVELFAADAAPPATRRLVNLSARGPVAPGRPLIAGFAIGGDLPVTLLIRAAGPELARYGVSHPLPDPRLTLHRGDEVLFANDDWSHRNATLSPHSGASAGTGAFAFSTFGADAAMLVTLAPGVYTAVAAGAGSESGTVLLELYVVD